MELLGAMNGQEMCILLWKVFLVHPGGSEATLAKLIKHDQTTKVYGRQMGTTLKASLHFLAQTLKIGSHEHS